MNMTMGDEPIARQPRRILRSSRTALVEMRDLVAAIVVAELLAPSRQLWLAAEHLHDAPVLDNRSGGFNACAHVWGERVVRLSEFLAHLLTSGTVVVIATPASTESQAFAGKILDAGGGGAAAGRLSVTAPGPTGPRGWVGDGYAVSGALRFTAAGVEMEEEGITFDAGGPNFVAARARFLDSYSDGGAS